MSKSSNQTQTIMKTLLIICVGIILINQYIVDAQRKKTMVMNNATLYQFAQLAFAEESCPWKYPLNYTLIEFPQRQMVHIPACVGYSVSGLIWETTTIHNAKAVILETDKIGEHVELYLRIILM